MEAWNALTQRKVSLLTFVLIAVMYYKAKHVLIILNAALMQDQQGKNQLIVTWPGDLKQAGGDSIEGLITDYQQSPEKSVF